MPAIERRKKKRKKKLEETKTFVRFVFFFVHSTLDGGAQGGDGQVRQPAHWAGPAAEPPLAEVRRLLHGGTALHGALISIVPALGRLLPHEFLSELVASLLRESFRVFFVNLQPPSLRGLERLGCDAVAVCLEGLVRFARVDDGRVDGELD